MLINILHLFLIEFMIISNAHKSFTNCYVGVLCGHMQSDDFLFHVCDDRDLEKSIAFSTNKENVYVCILSYSVCVYVSWFM